MFEAVLPDQRVSAGRSNQSCSRRLRTRSPQSSPAHGPGANKLCTCPWSYENTKSLSNETVLTRYEYMQGHVLYILLTLDLGSSHTGLSCLQWDCYGQSRLLWVVLWSHWCTWWQPSLTGRVWLSPYSLQHKTRIVFFSLNDSKWVDIHWLKHKLLQNSNNVPWKILWDTEIHTNPMEKKITYINFQL